MAKKAPEVAGARTKFQKFEAVEIHRSQLLNAPYNPRLISEKAKKKLRAGMNKHGLIAAPTWNRRTGNIVGGHRRMEVLDALEGHSDYTLTVDVVDMTDEQEKEANVLLNNDSAQGDYDLEKLEALFSDKSLSLEGMGFDVGDAYRMFGDAPLVNRDGAAEEMANTIREHRDAYNNSFEERRKTRDSQDFYLVVVFRDDDTVTDFCNKLGLPDNRYQDGGELLRMLTNPEERPAPKPEG